MSKLAERVTDIINNISSDNTHLLIAIDGRCAAGKTTLAMELKEIYSCNVIHMDDFFLRPEQRTVERLNTPGENVDYERFMEEVLFPLRRGDEFSYQPYDCKKNMLSEPILIRKNRINIIEGSYSCHMALWNYYDMRVFITVSPNEQMQRIIERNGLEKSEMFHNTWIPLEESYFKAFNIETRCDYCFGT